MRRKVLLASLLSIFGVSFSLHGIVIVNDTVISVTDTSYENKIIVISNCVVTVDGAHAFESLRVAAGATLRHSASADGTISITTSVTDEPQTLTGTNVSTLVNSNVVLSSVIVRDFSRS